MIDFVRFKEQKERVRSRIESEFRTEFHNKSVFIDLITEKLMAREFNQTFYRGEGLTTNNTSQSIIRFDFKSLIQALTKGLGISAYALIQVLQLRIKSKSIESLGWVYAVPNQFFSTRNQIGDLEKFLDATLKDKNIEPPTRYFVQSGSLKNLLESEKLEIVFHIGSKILSLENQNKLRCSFEIIKRTSFWLKTSIRHPVFLLIGSEYIVDVPAIELRKNRKKDLLITTQSQLLAPAYVFKSPIRARRIMYWYSNNSVQISKQKREQLDYSYLVQPQISEHFVWSSSWGKILQRHNRESQVTPIGPIIFKDLSGYRKHAKKKLEKTKKVTIFDVTPKKYVSRDSFYSDKEMQKFILDIVESIKPRYPEVLIRLKPKREYSSQDSVTYRDFLKSQTSNIKMLMWNCSIVSEILNSDLVICVPFSSPALISKHLGVPTVFYSPSVDFNLEQIHEGILILQGLPELQLFLKKSWESDALNLESLP
jgi:polysaccharide biosynthesis PFTS motif protein